MKVIHVGNKLHGLNAQVFEFQKRFQELLRLFPTETWLADRDLFKPYAAVRQELSDCTRPAGSALTGNRTTISIGR